MVRKLVLTKACICADCGKPMQVGESFRWLNKPRSVVGPKLGGSYTIQKVDSFKPAHTYDCFAVKIKEDTDARNLEIVNDACKLAAECGHDADWIAEYRVTLMRKLGLT